MAFPNDSHISNEISYKSEENMLSEHNYDRKPDVVLIDADFFNDPLLCNDILNKFHENISEESNPDVISYITYPHNAFAPCEKLVRFEAQVLNELEFITIWRILYQLLFTLITKTLLMFTLSNVRNMFQMKPHYS
ncbi:unnamed protein product [Schistosoma margrebowiei]|uniref:Uncharacterized protein n=1 Tax=Schistosoma margrebowiei TaxID=48269 RepID=A0A183LZS8_9TREM|nr:unnamed protein product [Schistosoma margrebowiei]